MSEVKKEYKVVIDRSKWRTGHNSPENATGKGMTRLTNGHGYSCCLGFICQQLMPDVEIDVWQSNDYPSGTGLSIPYLSEKSKTNNWGRTVDTELSKKAVRINDSEDTPVAEKEAALLALFADTPIELEFVGSPTPYNDERAVVE